MRADPLTMNWYTGRTNPVQKYNEPGYGLLNCGHYDQLDASVEGGWEFHDEILDGSGDGVFSKDQLSGLYAKLHVVRTLDQETPYNISDVWDYTGAMWQLPMRTEFLRASWNFCEQTYSDVSVDLGVLSVGNVSTNPLTLVPDDSYNIFHSNASGLNYTVAEGREWDIDELSQVLDLHLGYSPLYGAPIPTYISSDSNNMFCSTVQSKHWATYSDPFSEVPTLTESLSIYLRSADIEALTNNLANTLTARIRSNTTGNNANSTMLPGQAFVSEAYIEVQWPWMILPITETVLAAAALTMTIVLTRQQALLKGSTVSLLMHQIDGWSPDESRVRRLDTSEQLRDRAKKMVVRLDEGRDGEMVFKR